MEGAGGTTCPRRTRRRSRSTCSTLLGLFVLGRRLRGRGALGVALAYAWVGVSRTRLFVLVANSNDSLVAALVVWALVLPSRRRPGAAR